MKITSNGVKKTNHRWEKLSAKHITDKGLGCWMYKGYLWVRKRWPNLKNKKGYCVDSIIGPSSSPLTNIHTLCWVTLQFFPLTDQRIFLLPLWFGHVICFSLLEHNMCDNVPVASLSCKRHHVFSLGLLYFSHCHEKNLSRLAHWSQEEDVSPCTITTTSDKLSHPGPA